MPTLDQWRRDSSVTLAVRSHDVVLTNIDKLIEEFQGSNDGFVKLATACQLFFALDYWLKEYPKTASMDKGRAPAIEALYKFVAANYLCDRLKCTINTLPRELELLFGRELTGHGRVIDHADGAANYMSPLEAARYKLVFRQGLVYQFPWWNRNSPRNALELADSSHASSRAHVERGPNAQLFRTFGFFTMSMSRDIYMAEHYVAADPVWDGDGELVMLQTKGIYHSSYLSGVAAMFAGSMLIQAGRIRAIRSDSGHYQPADVNTAALLRTLTMHGIPINQIDVYDYAGNLDIDGASFMADNGGWAQILQQRASNMKQYGKAALFLEVEKYRREHKVSPAEAKKHFQDRYTVNVGGQRIPVKPIEPPKNPPAPAPSRSSSAYDLE
jgi:hypothetical protein